MTKVHGRWARENNQVSLLTPSDARLRKHADYQRVYQQSRKHFSSSMTYFFADRVALLAQPVRLGPRVGLTAGRVLGKAVDRNRIKRRMREAVRLNLSALTRDVDVVLHPRRTVMTAEFSGLQKEVSKIFAVIQKTESQKTAIQKTATQKTVIDKAAENPAVKPESPGDGQNG